MSEKRFTVRFVDGDYLAMPYFFDDGEEISDFDVVDLLNEQQAEIERLKELEDRYRHKVSEEV